MIESNLLVDGDYNVLVIPENSGVPFHMEQAMTLQRPTSQVASTALVAYSDISESLVRSIG